MAEIIRNVKNIHQSGLNLSFPDFGFIKKQLIIKARHVTVKINVTVNGYRQTNYRETWNGL